MPIHLLTLLDKKEIACDIYQFIFSKPKDFTFIPGQFGGFILPALLKTNPPQSTRRFSLLSAPTDEHISIATRMQNSIYKQTLLTLAIGEEIKFSGPTGNFILHTDNNIPAVFIAGGIGITPFYSMLKNSLITSHPPFILFYANRSKAHAALLNELSHLQKQCANFTFIPTFSQIPAEKDANNEEKEAGETGWITHTMIKKYIPDLSLPIFYICGSPTMVNSMHALLNDLEISEERIRVEDFPGY